MLKTLFFTMLLQLGWMDRQALWINRVNAPDLMHCAQLVKKAAASQAVFDGSVIAPKVNEKFPGSIWRQAAKPHGIDPVLLYSVALLESGKQAGRQKVGPWPFALHFNEANVSVYAASEKEARAVLAQTRTDNIDIGLGQVNYRSHKSKVRGPEDLLDPKINLAVAGRILAEALQSTPDQELGIGRYHSWTDWRARAYGRKVLAIYNSLKNLVGKQDAVLARQAASQG
jgi:hypothetical protein